MLNVTGFAPHFADLPRHEEAVYSLLQGGLGNLLFQYLTGLSHAEALDVPHYCVFPSISAHGSTLEALGLKPRYATLPERFATYVLRGKRRRFTEFKQRFGSPLPKLVWERGRKPFGIAPKPRKGSLLVGHWQRLENLARIEPHHYLRLTSLAERGDYETLSILKEPGSVAVHVRRGDYVSNPDANRYHGLIGRAFYDAARELIEQKTSVKHFVVFSDDLDAARQELSNWSNIYFPPRQTQEVDLAQMSMAEHAIIANSSFSWWGAYLNQNPNKVVVYPTNWVAARGPEKQAAGNAIPEDWVGV
ncbi:MAG: alpha-1,2-fucosyltransferase [Pseudomonadota bacterium]